MNADSVVQDGTRMPVSSVIRLDRIINVLKLNHFMREQYQNIKSYS